MSLAELDHALHEEATAALYQRLKAKIISPCTKCRGTGRLAVSTEWHGLVPATKTKPCECKLAVLHDVRLHEAGVPRELWRAGSIDPEFNPDNYAILRMYADELTGLVQAEGLSLLLCGENGTGKTSSAMLPVLRALNLGLTAALVSWPDLITGRLSKRFDTAQQQATDERLNRFMLVVDEIGKESVTQSQASFAQSTLDSLIRNRRGTKPTVLITNHDFPSFAERYGASVKSLMAHPYEVLIFEPGDYRPKVNGGWSKLLGGAR